MRWSASAEHPVGELGYGSAEMNAAIFHGHFKQLYGRAPSGKMEVLKHIPKQRVFTELDHEPTDEEIPKAVLGLNFSGLGGAQVWQQQSGSEALMADDECSEFVFAYTCVVFGEAR
jgi:hypothetical protein